MPRLEAEQWPYRRDNDCLQQEPQPLLDTPTAVRRYALETSLNPLIANPAASIVNTNVHLILQIPVAPGPLKSMQEEDNEERNLQYICHSFVSISPLFCVSIL
ncbi:hypothetical protein PCANC_17809 [Puccinia coronata f. sp. avenae]|uniref:Uncharacterized protein n=1 Tax=Puccinia coronata f. sp. avenae TaxID=200324 RepID=A0A2N5SIB4_9BASI|nr:hypothetical protein PCANC_17809 [Puccinia coronata f. sp. avenae]PLW16041.1 hypothetical protein PCASD_20692 [Puccinia coronata f. sp. avenae]PLW46112.1 hypothetical protein PCASD_04167 [Puccinia coronata f. sp. avenae]